LQRSASAPTLRTAVDDALTAVEPDEGRTLDVIEAIYREHGPRFRRVALAIVEDADAAEDVVQDAFASAMLRRRSLRGREAAAGWLWRITVNAAVNRRRRAVIERRALDRVRGLACTQAHEDDRDSAVRAFVARLPERQRVALFLRYYADLEYEAIGAVLSIAPGTVAKLLHDARARIRRAIEAGAHG
jgi:RNA polymerase sigma factor (sigma-70 family)